MACFAVVTALEFNVLRGQYVSTSAAFLLSPIMHWTVTYWLVRAPLPPLNNTPPPSAPLPLINNDLTRVSHWTLAELSSKTNMQHADVTYFVLDVFPRAKEVAPHRVFSHNQWQVDR